ncbi:MAG: pseudouridine synthase [Ignavibacteria bacterium CG_4_8_14_3_um_filter_37_9]|nr:pseudouridine synthase [Ignavibacteria bacterium]OIO23180.1 MAG: pseudouridine synthase [Ignavibacteria bacterium CG1_02_37_35]PIW99712.1 MAG: pseudouridine synthase [Ignavibacteria bacterium CG_4_8_14_3_um_filter_37_9]PIX95020.1 MAG: pseudouridine synthase [Ignavibacteria bacterium CG_4_10_14_3_um_filter_37_18]PJC59440.1 MAG: pseudouridine synthase [Ignavibacteria bacterium CG_4_9_14_0_2_um_filter_37_13]
MKKSFKYFVAHKPFRVLTQFTDAVGRKTLTDLFTFPKDVYPVGRLDYDSEGLLLLTNDKALTDKLLHPKHKLEKEYFVQVEGTPTEAALTELRGGVLIENKKTLPAKVIILNKPPQFEERIPPIRFRKTIPTTWLGITIIEGRNRQVRKMTAKVGYPTLRLVRIRIGNIHLGNLRPGKVREINFSEIKLWLI